MESGKGKFVLNIYRNEVIELLQEMSESVISQMLCYHLDKVNEK